ncbi:hypothetical protein CBR_g36956 [Chara braunii]|uniref:Uncharacterized protein n=1 Tax=Chara braunii TaxID=69332 RepID=A0A388JZH0_CHABU|nr:hypothetical protein CBR_g36956 [Chara braunii]|eukprot:GBG63188.1 hypothetical protein CBR_g36956 [Chara braunii]
MGQGNDEGGTPGSREYAAATAAPGSGSGSEDQSWEQMALFLDAMPENPEENADLAALQALQYDDYTPEEVAESLKSYGDDNDLRSDDDIGDDDLPYIDAGKSGGKEMEEETQR